MRGLLTACASLAYPISLFNQDAASANGYRKMKVELSTMIKLSIINFQHASLVVLSSPESRKNGLEGRLRLSMILR